MASTALFVGKISRDATEEDIRAEFGKFGQLKRCALKKGFAFVTFEEQADADDALSGLQGKDLLGSSLFVEYAKPRNTDREGCFRCHQTGHWARDCPEAGGRSPRRGYSPRRDVRRRDDYGRGRDDYGRGRDDGRGGRDGYGRGGRDDYGRGGRRDDYGRGRDDYGRGRDERPSYRRRSPSYSPRRSVSPAPRRSPSRASPTVESRRERSYDRSASPLGKRVRAPASPDSPKRARLD